MRSNIVLVVVLFCSLLTAILLYQFEVIIPGSDGGLSIAGWSISSVPKESSRNRDDWSSQTGKSIFLNATSDAGISSTAVPELEPDVDITDLSSTLRLEENNCSEKFCTRKNHSLIEENIVKEFYQDSEFFRRILEASGEWLDELFQSKRINVKNYTSQAFDTVSFRNLGKRICLFMYDYNSGIGNRFFRDALVFHQSWFLNCTLALDWGWEKISCNRPAVNVATNTTPNWRQHVWYDNEDVISLTQQQIDANYNVNGSHEVTRAKIWDQYLAGIPWVYYVQQSEIPASYWKITEPRAKNFYSVKMLDTVPTQVKKMHMMRSNTSQDVEEKQNWNISLHGWCVGSSIVDHEIDPEYIKIRPYQGHLELFPVLKYYGLLMVHLKKEWRDQSVAFIEENFKNKDLILGWHFRFGNGKKMNRYAPSQKEAIAQTVGCIMQIFSAANDTDDVVINERFLTSEINKTKPNVGLFIASDTGSFIPEIQNATQLLPSKIGFLQSNETNTSNMFDVLVRPQTRYPEGHGDFGLHYKSESERDPPSKCMTLLADVYTDCETLGLVDILFIPYGSTFTRVSRAWMMKRKKTICYVADKNHRSSIYTYRCKNFATGVKWTFDVPKFGY